jgi:hypothetical protein
MASHIKLGRLSDDFLEHLGYRKSPGGFDDDEHPFFFLRDTISIRCANAPRVSHIPWAKLNIVACLFYACEK